MDLNKFIEKVEANKDHKLDLSSDEDLSIAIMNLVSLEEHFFFTGAKTENHHYYDLLSEVREMRKDLLKKIIKDTEGEEWCISKHLLAASMRVFEVGTKAQGRGKKEEAREYFEKAFHLYGMFWAIALKAISVDGVKKIDDEQLHKEDKEKSVGSKFGALVKKIIDCCME